MTQQLPVQIQLSWLREQPQTIEEYRLAVQTKLADYDYEVTEENRKEAEQDKTSLNTAAKAISDARKKGFADIDSIKKQMIAVEHLIEDKAKAIGDQLKALDEHLLIEKWQGIETYFSTLNFDLVPLKQLVDFKWELKKYPVDTCCKMIAAKVDTINKELSLIDSMAYTAEEKLEVQNLYLSNLDLTGAIQQFEENKAKREALLQRQQAVFAQKTPHREVVQEQTQQIQTETKVSSNITENVATTRLVVEFVVQGRDFLDYMNAGIREFHPKVRIIEREEI